MTASNVRRMLRRLLLALSLVWLAAPAPAADAPSLTAFSASVHNFEAHFTQLQKDEHGQTMSQSFGLFQLSRPGKFRWKYERPYEQLIVCDGERIWTYEPDLRQVTVRPSADALSGTPAALLSSHTALQDEFHIEDRGVAQGLQALRLTPKADADFSSIDLWTRDGVPVRMVFVDTLGGSTEVRFDDIRINGKLDAAAFSFKPPKGVEVVESASVNAVR